MISIAIGLFGIAATVFLYYKDKGQAKDSSSFFEYRLISERSFIKKLKKTVLIKLSIILACYAFVMTGILIDGFWSVSKEALRGYQTINSCVICGIALASTIFVQFVAFIDSEWIDKLIKTKAVNKTTILGKRDTVLVLFYLISAAICTVIVCANHELLGYCAYAIILTGIGLDAVFCQYLYTYLNLRLQFVVTEISVKAKFEPSPFKDVYNYGILKGTVDVMIREKGALRRIYFPESELEYIEKTINEEGTLLDTSFKDWVVQRKDKKKKEATNASSKS